MPDNLNPEFGCPAEGLVVRVADGVGGWRHYGIDSSLFSSALMESCRRFVMDGGLETPSPISVIKAGFQELTEHKEPLFGNSTACIMVLDKKSQTLHSANLGDSGFLVIRQGSVVHQSSEMQHYFNTPYQLAIPPPGQAGAVIEDSLDEAESTSFSVELGDLIVLATDGLFDNVSTERILKELSQLEDHSTESIQHITDSLAHLARTHSYDPHYLSPFAEQARCEGINITGGKPDDITVLIAVVSEMGEDLDT
ncbi:protein phosphatase PTC7 homolog [Oculina patagonica]